MQVHDTGHISVEMLVYTGMFSFFVIDYLYHEHVQLYTYDLFAERLGFKLLWGCLCFYPYFYTCGIWAVLEHTGRGYCSSYITYLVYLVWQFDVISHSGTGITGFTAICLVLCFLAGWIISRGANNQKYTFKVAPTKKFLGIIEPRTIQGSRILCSGWWGLARHFNYLGEILMAIALGSLFQSLLNLANTPLI